MKNKVKFYRKKIGLSQEALANAADVNRHLISDLENGKASVIMSTSMIKICRVLDRSLDDVFGVNV